jgi:NAD(P)-dependent dehydrogenase (short-subunit alcohol dehydrogenase family)
VFGARNLGHAVLADLAGRGYAIAGAARSAASLADVRALGGLAVEADVTDQASVEAAATRVAAELGGLDLVVNAAAAYGGTRTGPFGGGPVADAAASAFADWSVAPAQAAFAFLSGSARVAQRLGAPATLVQVTGGSSRRAMPGRGLWAAGAFAVRAITQAAALELRDQGIHVALLIVDAGIEPRDGAREGADLAALADPRQVAEAVAFLAAQGPRAATHELQLTPLAERWVP